MECFSERELCLQKEIERLKINLEKIPKEDQEGKYKEALLKQKKKILSLCNEYASEDIFRPLFFDLREPEEEELAKKLTEVAVRDKPRWKKEAIENCDFQALREAYFDSYMELLNDRFQIVARRGRKENA